MTDIQAWLDQGKTLADQATEGPWEAFQDSDRQPAGCPPEIENLVYAGAVETPIIDWGNGSTKPDAAFIADARTRLPQALNALQAILDLHQNLLDVTILDELGRTIFTRRKCSTCSPNGGYNAVWPCPTVRAIHDALERQQ